MGHGPLDRRIGLRLPESVAEAWKAAAKASRKSLSDWVRGQVSAGNAVTITTGKKTPAKASRQVVVNTDPALIREVAKIGNNLNQIARKLNGGAHPDTAMLVALLGIEQQLVELVKDREG